MPRGGGRGNKKSHKGQRRHFTTEEEMKAQAEKAEKQKEWRRERGIPSDEESDEEGAAAKKEESGSEESDSEEEAGEAGKNKGVSHLIEVANPNRTGAATKTKKVTTLNEAEGPQLSRREREEVQKQQAAAHYRKMHLAGKTDEARADMARLAIIRKQREEQAAKKSAEAKVRDDAKKTAEQKLLDKKKAQVK